MNPPASRSFRPSNHRLFLGLLFVSLLSALSPQLSAAEVKKSYDVPAGPAEQTLKTFSSQSGQEVLFATKTTGRVQTKAVKGDYTAREAVDQMLDGTGLTAAQDAKTGALTVTSDPNGPRLAQKNSDQPTDRSDKIEGGVIKLETFEVMGSKLLNMDIRRSRDDAQPYVIFGRESIERSGAVNLEDFLKQRLTMNTVSTTNSQSATFQGNGSQVNLRGLGTNQTLILIDGHRTSGSKLLGSSLNQTDLNGIPLAAVERIEVLPTTASGIYGGNATGGVVNIILRRDYAGTELKVTYENTFDSDVARRRVDLAAGLTLEDGKTNVLLSASYSDSNLLATADRDFIQRGRARILANNPGILLNATTPVLGATPNVRSATGANLVLKSGAALNSPITFVPAGYLGASTDGGAALVPNAGRHNLDLADTGQQPGGGRQGLLNAPTLASVSATVRRQFTPRLQAFVELAAANNRGFFPFSNVFGSFTIAATAPNNPFIQAINVTPPTDSADRATHTLNQDRRIAGGVIFDLGQDWTAEADFTWNLVRTDFAQPVGLSAAASADIGNGTIDILRDLRVTPVNFSPYVLPDTRLDPPFRSRLHDAAVRAAGPLWEGSSGTPVSLAFLLEHREEVFQEGRNITFFNTRVYPEMSQLVRSVYAELKVPLVGMKNQKPGLRELDIQLAGRHDAYESNGSTPTIVEGVEPVAFISRRTQSTNPTLGLRYKPFEAVALRASYGTGFVPPTVAQLVPNPPFNLGGGLPLDPKRGNTSTGPIITTGGGSPTLRPEESESWSAGVILTPKFPAGLRVSADYTRIEKTDNITILSFQQVLNNEDIVPGRVVRGPVPPGDPFGVGPVISIENSFINIARAELEAYDVAVDYQKKSTLGTFDAYFAATWQPHYRTQLLPTTPLVENAGVTSVFPLRFKANAGLTWKHGSWSAGWTVRHFDSYVVSTNAAVVLAQGATEVPKQNYHDVFVGYRFARQALGWRRAFSGLELQVGIKNVLGDEPPVDLGISASRYYSPYGDPLLTSYQVSVKRVF